AVIGPIFANTAGLFPVRNRKTGFGISFNISVYLFGGTVAFLMTLLITTTGNYLIPALYIMFLCILFLLLYYSFQKAYKNSYFRKLLIT
ncbi:symporter, partial [Francisella tularensis subsp. holarctica]|nr:symporter [Francisella tularensis subsp. holarctica]